MPKEILRKEAQRLIEAGAQVVDVLELSEYRESHLPRTCTSTSAGSLNMRERSWTRVAP